MQTKKRFKFLKNFLNREHIVGFTVFNTPEYPFLFPTTHSPKCKLKIKI